MNASKFNVGDKVRIKGVAYNEGEYDTISLFNREGIARLDYHDEGQDWWDTDELYFYEADNTPSLKESSLLELAPTSPAPVDILAAKNDEIAALKAEVERLMRGMDETLNVVQEYQKVAIHPSDVAMFKHIANTLVRSMLAQEQAPQAAPVQAAVTLVEMDCHSCFDGIVLDMSDGETTRTRDCTECHGTGTRMVTPEYKQEWEQKREAMRQRLAARREELGLS